MTFALRRLSPVTGESELATKAVLELEGSNAITSMCLVRFEGAGVPDASTLLAVGTAEQLTYFPTSCTGGHIRIYRCVCLCECTY
jgi:hypothetical protein